MIEYHFADNEDLPKTLRNNEIVNYFEQYKNGDIDAREKIIVHNLRLVLYVAKKYDNTSYEKDELILIGSVGLINAVDSFDTSKNYNFSTYAWRCINNEILRFIKAEKKYIKNNISLNIVVSDAEEIEIEDTLLDKDSDFIWKLEDEDECEYVRNLVESLPTKDKEIIKLYFGFYNNRCYTQEEISECMGLSRFYISKKIKSVLMKLKSQIDKNTLDKKPLKLKRGRRAR